jgi:hypothetical protein
MNEEVLRILKMIEEGKLTAEKGKELIEAMQKTEIASPALKNYGDKFLRIKVLSGQGDKVNIQLPVKVIKEIIKITGKLPIDTKGMSGVDMEEIVNTIIACLDSESMGEIVNVESAEGDLVKIVIE